MTASIRLILRVTSQDYLDPPRALTMQTRTQSYVSIDGGSTWTQYDTVTVTDAVPEFPIGMAITLFLAMVVYVCMARFEKEPFF